MMMTPTLLVTPAAALPAVSPSNAVAAAIASRAAVDVLKTLDAASSATKAAASAVAATIKDAAKAAAVACATAAKVGTDALCALWTRCTLALARLFGSSSRSTSRASTMPDASASTATIASVSETSTVASAPLTPAPSPEEKQEQDPEALVVSAETATALAMVPAAVPAPRSLPAAVPASRSVPAALLAHTITITITTTTSSVVSSLVANDRKTHRDPRAVPLVVMVDQVRLEELAALLMERLAVSKTLVLPEEVKDEALALDDRPTVAYGKALMIARHEAWGRTPVPFDTVLRIIMCLHRRNGGRAFFLEYPFAIVDVVLDALAWHEHDVAAAFEHLTRGWLCCYGVLTRYRSTHSSVCPEAVAAAKRKLTHLYKP